MGPGQAARRSQGSRPLVRARLPARTASRGLAGNAGTVAWVPPAAIQLVRPGDRLLEADRRRRLTLGVIGRPCDEGAVPPCRHPVDRRGDRVSGAPCPFWVSRVAFVKSAVRPVYPKQQTFSGPGRHFAFVPETDRHFALLGRAFQADGRGFSPIEGGLEGGG